MKKILFLIACGFLLTLSSGWSQQIPPIGGAGVPPQPSGPALPTFNLDFPGGSPHDLVNAIEKATGKPLNVIIDKEDEDVQIPPLKMNEVNVSELFNALKTASPKYITTDRISYTTSYGFNTVDGRPTESSIWFFHADKGRPALAPRFYSLAPYLERGFTVDDITTAIQTGWKMEGQAVPDNKATMPELNYHKETRMLIAEGNEAQLNTIASVLQALPRTTATTTELEDLRNSVANMHAEINKLKSQVELLTQKLADEKSGK